MSAGVINLHTVDSLTITELDLVLNGYNYGSYMHTLCTSILIAMRIVIQGAGLAGLLLVVRGGRGPTWQSWHAAAPV